MGLFDDDIALTPVDGASTDGSARFACTISTDHWVIRGPNGGYLAAIAAHAGDRHLADPTRTMRGFTIHYMRAPVAGPADLVVETLHGGRSVAFLRVEMHQDGRRILTATGTWAGPRPGVEMTTATMPGVDQPDQCPRIDQVRVGDPLPIHGQWEIRAAQGRLFSGADAAELAWWIRPPRHRPLDAPMLAAMADAMPPPVFAMISEPLAVPTLDLTVHIRAELDEVAWAPGDWILARFATGLATGGYLEEDGELWTATGVLVAQSRQLALAL